MANTKKCIFHVIVFSCPVNTWRVKEVRTCLWSSPLGLLLSIFALKNKTTELLVRHMIWPTVISCISKGCFGEKQRQGSASLSRLYLETLDFSFDPSPSALSCWYACHYFHWSSAFLWRHLGNTPFISPGDFFLNQNHISGNFLQTELKNIYDIFQSADPISWWLLVTWPLASLLAFFFSQATKGTFRNQIACLLTEALSGHLFK